MTGTDASDATHFKAGPKTQPRSSTGAGASQDNWVLRMNIL
jgi:hypothetical protein